MYICSMKRIAILLFTALCFNAVAQHVSDSAWDGRVRTAQLYREGEPLEAPLLTLGREGELLVLEFDLLETEARSLRWHVGHCDADWRRDDLGPQEFMSGWNEGPIDSYDFSFTTLTDYVHYRLTLPDAMGSFTASGNYALAVIDEATGDTLLTRRFCVSEQAVRIDATVGRPYDGVALRERQEVDVALSVRDGVYLMLRPEYERVLVQQNGRQDNRRWLEFSGYDGGSLAYRFRRCNIFDAGNTFRFFDMSNLRTPMYNIVQVEDLGGEITAFVRPCEDRSRGHYIAETVLPGGMKVNIWDRNRPQTEADYVWVMLSLPMEQPMLEGEVHVCGALTDWRLDESTRMDYNPKQRAYVKRLLLKQGYYAYQLLTKPMRSSEGETGRLEGNHHETPNRYTVYVYHREPSDRSDRLVAVRRLASGE